LQLVVKNVSLIVILALFSLSGHAAEYGQSSKETELAADSSRVNSLIANSSEYRRSIKVGRSVAGQSAKDLKWAQEFEELMNSTKEVDYLELSLKL